MVCRVNRAAGGWTTATETLVAYRCAPGVVGSACVDGVHRLITVVGPDVTARQDEIADPVRDLVSGPPRRAGA